MRLCMPAQLCVGTRLSTCYLLNLLLIGPVSQTKKMRLREVKRLVQVLAAAAAV